jgi:hypothetical protein
MWLGYGNPGPMQQKRICPSKTNLSRICTKSSSAMTWPKRASGRCGIHGGRVLRVALLRRPRDCDGKFPSMAAMSPVRVWAGKTLPMQMHAILTKYEAGSIWR